MRTRGGGAVVSSPPTQLLVHKRLFLFLLGQEAARRAALTLTSFQGQTRFLFEGRGSGLQNATGVRRRGSRWRCFKVSPASLSRFFRAAGGEPKQTKEEDDV